MLTSVIDRHKHLRRGSKQIRIYGSLYPCPIPEVTFRDGTRPK